MMPLEQDTPEPPCPQPWADAWPVTSKEETNMWSPLPEMPPFTCGITLEALNNIACSTKKFILVLNDNEWSIAKNAGAFSKYFNELITNPVYSRLHKDAGKFLSLIPGGDSFKKFLSKAKRDTKELLAPSSIFEKLGIRFVGPIDGHSVNAMTGFFEFAKTSDEPIVLHLLTQKEKVSPSLWRNPKSGMDPGPSISKQELPRKPSPDPRRNIKACSGNASPRWQSPTRKSSALPQPCQAEQAWISCKRKYPTASSTWALRKNTPS